MSLLSNPSYHAIGCPCAKYTVIGGIPRCSWFHCRMKRFLLTSLGTVCGHYVHFSGQIKLFEWNPWPSLVHLVLRKAKVLPLPKAWNKWKDAAQCLVCISPTVQLLVTFIVSSTVPLCFFHNIITSLVPLSCHLARDKCSNLNDFGVRASLLGSHLSHEIGLENFQLLILVSQLKCTTIQGEMARKR